MKLPLGLLLGAGLLALPATAQAACPHNGITYAVGAQLCIGGWLKSCTPANYWKAVGYCKKDDDAGGVTPIRFPSGRDESEAPAAVPAAAPVAR